MKRTWISLLSFLAATSAVYAVTYDGVDSRDDASSVNSFVLQQPSGLPEIFEFLDSSGISSGRLAEPPVGLSWDKRSNLDRRIGDYRLLSPPMGLDLPKLDSAYIEQPILGVINPHGFYYLDDYRSMYICYQTSPGTIARIPIDDPSSYDVYQFPSDGEHGPCQSIAYNRSDGRIYLAFTDNQTGRIAISSIDPELTAHADPFPSVVADAGPLPAIVSDGTYVYHCPFTSPDSVIRKLDPVTGTQVGSYTWTGRDGCHKAEFDGNDLYFVNGASDPSNLYLLKLNPDMTTAEEVQLEGLPNLQFGSGYAYMGTEGKGYQGLFVRIRKSDLAPKEEMYFPFPAKFSGLGNIAYDGAYDGIWVGAGFFSTVIHFDPAKRQSVMYPAGDGQNWFWGTPAYPDGRGRYFGSRYAVVNAPFLRISEFPRISAVLQHPPGVDKAIYADSFPIFFDEVRVDGTQCTKDNQTIGSGPDADVIHCDDNGAGTIQGVFRLPSDHIVYHLATFQLDATLYSDLDSGRFSFIPTCACASPLSGVPDFGGTVSCTDDDDCQGAGLCVSGTCLLDFELASASTLSRQTANLRCVNVNGDQCKGGDWVYWKLQVDSTATTPTSQPNTFLVGLRGKYPINGMGDAIATRTATPTATPTPTVTPTFTQTPTNTPTPTPSPTATPTT